MSVRHHHHEHGHEDACGCGHDHDHGHEHAHGHAPGHAADCECELCALTMPDNMRERAIPAGFTRKVYHLENLGCANCAAKMEKAIGELDGVDDAVVTYSTRQLKLTAKDPDALLGTVQAICARIEDGVRVVPLEEAKQKLKGSARSGLWADKKTLLSIVFGAAFFIAAMAHWVPETVLLPCLIVAYVLLGGKIVWTAVKNLLRGRIFDENFLMTVATLGAFYLGEYEEAVGVLLFFRIGEFFEERAVEKSRRQIMDVVDMRPEKVNVVKADGQIASILAENAQIGDVIVIKAGERIPLDGEILEGETQLDTSPITGEPVPVSAACGSKVVSGCVNVSGVVKMRVEKVLAESMVTKILDSVENAAASKPTIERFITRFARVYTPFVVGAAVLIAIVPSLMTGDWNYWVYTALTFLVMSCPCALVLSVPLAFFSGIGVASKAGILLKGGAAIEALRRIDVVAMDKTGTITKGEFTVKEVHAVQGTDSDLLALCAACEQHSTHPIALSVLHKARGENLLLPEVTEIEEIAGFGLKAKEAATGREILCGSRAFLEQRGIAAASPVNLAATEVYVAVGGAFCGCIYISDTIKESSIDAIAAMKALQLKTAMFTGDTEETAAAVAAQTKIEIVKAKLLPQDKLSALQELRQKAGRVMFVGDGINDAPVLAGADVGAAMGTGSDAALEAADVVFMTSDLRAVPQSIKIAKETTRIAWQNVVVAIGIKIAVMLLGLLGMASMWLAVFADSGVAILCVLNSIRMLYYAKIE